MSNVDAKTRLLVKNRDGSRCARCGKYLKPGDWDYGRASIHHRRLRSHRFAGTDLPANLICLCGSGTSGCHGWVHAHPKEAQREGWIVSAYKLPEHIPVTYYPHRRWLLDNEGTGVNVETKIKPLEMLAREVAAERKRK